MAQDIIEKIRAAAQAKGVDPDTALRIAGVESEYTPSAQNTRSTAGGLFQVIDDTWKRYGGKPGMKHDVDENIRVGTDILADNMQKMKQALGRAPRASEVYAAHFFGPQVAQTVLATDPDTALNKVLTPKVLEANPQLRKKTVGQFVGELQAKFDKEAPAKAVETPAQKEMPDFEAVGRSQLTAQATPAPQDRMQQLQQRVAQLGPGYQAALAAAVLAEDDDEEADARKEGRAREMLAQENAAPPPQLLANLNIRASNPFPEAKMAEGGEVKNEDESLSEDQGQVYPGREEVSPFAYAGKHKTSTADIESLMAGLNVDKATLGINVARMKQGDKDTLAGALMAAYRERVGDATVNASVSQPIGSGAAGTYMGGANISYPVGQGHVMAGVNGMRDSEQGPRVTGYNLGYSGKVGPGTLDASINFPKGASPMGQLQYRIPLAEGGEVKEPSILSLLDYSRSTAHEMYPGEQGQDDKQDAARHMLAAATLAKKVGPDVAEFLGKTHEFITSPAKAALYAMGLGKMPKDYEQDLHNNRRGIEVGKGAKSQADLERLINLDVERAAKQKMSDRPWVYRAGGGDAEPTAEEIAAASQPARVNPMIQRQGEAARRLAQMRDVNTLPDPRTYAAASGFMGQAPDEQGFSVMHPDAAAIRKAGQAGFAGSFVAPALGMVMSGMAPSRAALGTNLAKMEGAVKPRGGTWMPSGRLDDLLDNYANEASRANPQNADIYRDIMEKKARKYFQNDFGTADDKLRVAIAKGEISLFGKDVETLPPYLLEAARNPNAVGHEIAKRHLEKGYDTAADVRGQMYTADKPEAYTLRQVKENEIRQKMEQEGVPLEYQNHPFYNTVDSSDISKYPSNYEQVGRLLEQADKGVLPPNLLRALQQNEVMYDVGTPSLSLFDAREIGKGIAALDPSKLKSMSFEQMVIESAKKLEPIRDYNAAIEKAASGAQVPKEVLFRFTQPVVDTDAGKWVQLTDAMATKMEGKLMKHSVGGYAEGDSYGTMYTGLPYGGKKAFDDGLVKVFSLRNEKGYPTTTLEMAKSAPDPDAPWIVTQIRGKFNSQPPEQEFESIFKFLDKQPADIQIKAGSYANNVRGEQAQGGSRVNWEKAYDDYRFNPGSEYKDAITEF